jgi:hypothetical protein
MRVIIPTNIALPIRRPRGSTVTFVNQSGTDVFIDSDYSRLNATVAGVPPDGTRLVNAGGQVQITNYPGVMYARAAAITELEVQP